MSKKLIGKAAAVLLALTAISPCAVLAAEFPEKIASVYVYDEAEVISPETEKDINSRADALFAMSGAQIMTVCINTTDGTPIGEYATSLFNEWQIGSPQRENGLLCVMAIDDREYWLLQGNGIKDEITDGQLQVINNDYLEDYFAEGNYDAGAKAVFDQLLMKFEDLYSIDITTWDGKYIDFTYPEPQGTETTAPIDTPAYNMMGFLTTFLWIAAAVVLVIIIIAVVVVMRRPKFVDGGYFRRRKYKGERGPYVGIPPQMSLKSKHPSSGNTVRRNPNGHHPNGSHPNGPHPNGQRPSKQRPNRQPPNGQRPSNARPNGQHPSSSRTNPQPPRPMNPQNMNGQNVQRNPQRRPSPQQDNSRTVYPDNPPYVNGNPNTGSTNNIRRNNDNRNGGLQ